MKVSKRRGTGGHGPVSARVMVAGAALVTAAGLAAGGLVPAPAAAAGATSRGPGAARSAGAPPAAAGSTAVSQRAVTLINGDRVLVTRSGREQQDAVAPAGAGVNRALLRMDLGGQAYEVPADAVPFLGRGLSPSLFEVSSLLAAESGGRLPVRVSYQGTLHRVPGVTITKSGGGTAQGYLTAKSAVAFGAALARQLASDHTRDSYGSDGMFASGLSIGLPGQSAAAPARPDYPMHTLTVTGTGLTGKPDNGDTIELFSADNLARFGYNFNDIFSSFYHGVAKYSVPAGHYTAIATFDVMSGSTITGLRTVVLPQFTVSGNTTVAVAESSASDQVQVVTPRPAVTQDTTLSIDRGTANGSSFSQDDDAGALPQWINTTEPGAVTVGTLQTFMTARLISPASAGQQYEYDLAFAGPAGRIASQRYVVTSRNVAVVRAAYYQGAASTGAWLPASFFGSQVIDGSLLLFSDIYPFTLPQSETQYTSAGPSLYWQSSYVQSYQSFAGGQYDTTRAFVPGTSVTLAWNAYPLQPSPEVNLLGTANPLAALPTASRAGNKLTVYEIPFGDNTPGHNGFGLSTGFPAIGKASGSYVLDQNGTKIASGKVSPDLGYLALQANLSGQPATDRLVLNASRTGSLFRLSTRTQTVWTWRSAPDPGAVLPAGWICPAGNQACSVQPLMTLLYQVAEMGLDGSVAAANQLVVIKAGQLQLAPASPVTAMTVSVSFDNGRSWQPAGVSSLGGGRFGAAFTAPAGTYVSLRVQASDGAGDSITQTVTKAYQTSL